MKTIRSQARPVRFARGFLHCVAAASIMMLGTAGAARGQVSHHCLSANAPDSTAATVLREGVSILSDTSVGMRSIRTNYGIPFGTIADVSIVQDNIVCSAAMTSFEAFTGKHFPETFVIVRLGTAATHFYLMTPRREGALSARYLLDARFGLLTFIGGDG
jgi:hypothetical protein